MKKWTMLVALLLSLVMSAALVGCGESSNNGGNDNTPPDNIEQTPADKDFTGVTFADVSVLYDGEQHSIAVTGAPENTTITYSPANAFTDAGKYDVTATLSLDGYKTATLTATFRFRLRV